MATTLPEIETFLSGLVGPLGGADTMTVELGAVRKMARAVEDADPIHYDAAAATRRGYRGVVAPWPFVWLMYFNGTEHQLDFPFGKATVHGEDEYEFHEPMIVGDEITMRTEITDARARRGRSGLLGIVVQERRFTNQLGRLCAVLRTTVIRR
ncbi:MAG: MaoC family dehydratase N-terminal domain-containing protein [Candidatus Rokubacteria bacterium]|nr:MaoC family dehydratase N-terminal domain-containing protein [Candidatus Rokubacteria bacterium]